MEIPDLACLAPYFNTRDPPNVPVRQYIKTDIASLGLTYSVTLLDGPTERIDVGAKK